MCADDDHPCFRCGAKIEDHLKGDCLCQACQWESEDDGYWGEASDE